jgi:hypothetical protein
VVVCQFRRSLAQGDRRAWSASLSVRLRGLLDRFADADIGPTAADVAGHRTIDVGVVRMRIVRQQGGRGHDLARLAVAALNDFMVEPCLLNLPAGRRIANCLDRGDRRAAYAIDCCDAGADRASVQMNRACATECHAAAELGAGHAEHVAQHPQERGVTVDINGMSRSVHVYCIRHSPPPALDRGYLRTVDCAGGPHWTDWLTAI